MKPSGKKHYHVTTDLAGETLPAILRHWQTELSWNAARKLLAQRRVSVNGTICVDMGRRLKSGDVLHLLEHSKTPLPTADHIEILYLDPHLVVAVKPALMTTLRHAEEKHWSAKRKNFQPTMDESLPLAIAKYEGTATNPGKKTRPQQKKGGTRGNAARGRGKEGVARVRPVHRLDRDTSGIMVFARTPSAETQLIRQFKRHSIERFYQAIVLGHPQDQTIESHFVRDRGDGLRGSVDEPHEDSERALTHVRVLERLGDYSLVECRLETGRTHQIRIHLSEAGHLVCGDNVYCKRLHAPPFKDRSGAPRLALHAWRLEFEHPITKENMAFKKALPKDLAKFVARLRESPSPPVAP